MGVALVIDDNKQTAEALIQMLGIWDIKARLALGPSAAMAILGELTPNVVFLDINQHAQAMKYPLEEGDSAAGGLRREASHEGHRTDGSQAAKQDRKEPAEERILV